MSELAKEKTRFTDVELDEFKILIEKKLERAIEELGFYKNELRHAAENDDQKVKGLDDGSSTIEAEFTSSIVSRQEKYIKHLQNALIRIENKVYGICRESGKLISKERLRAVPHATLSIEAKKNQK